jgi:hypothetical protein
VLQRLREGEATILCSHNGGAILAAHKTRVRSHIAVFTCHDLGTLKYRRISALSILLRPNAIHGVASARFTPCLRVNPATVVLTPGGGEECRARAPFGPQQRSPWLLPSRRTTHSFKKLQHRRGLQWSRRPRSQCDVLIRAAMNWRHFLRYPDPPANHGSAGHPRDRSLSAATQRAHATPQC